MSNWWAGTRWGKKGEQKRWQYVEVVLSSIVLLFISLHRMHMHRHMPHRQTLSSTDLHKQSMGDRLWIGLPVGIADTHQYNWMNPVQPQRTNGYKLCWLLIRNYKYKMQRSTLIAQNPAQKRHSDQSQPFLLSLDLCIHTIYLKQNIFLVAVTICCHCFNSESSIS